MLNCVFILIFLGLFGCKKDAQEILQNPDSIAWQKSFGGSKFDNANIIQQTTDEGYIIIGTTESSDGDITKSKGSEDAWIVKTNPIGEIEWQKSLGGSYHDLAISGYQTVSNGFIIAGHSISNDGDVEDNQGHYDIWILKLFPSGEVEWKKSFGGSNEDKANSIIPTSDGGFIVAGYTSSNDGDISQNHGMSDALIMKFDSSGEIEWQKLLGGSNNDQAYDICQTNNGGYVFIGGSWSDDGDLTLNQGIRDIWVVRLTSTGEIEWQKTIGGSDNERASSVKQTPDYGYVISATSTSNDGDFTENKGLHDVWIIKLTQNGEIEWNKAFGGSSSDEVESILTTNDGGYIFAGGSSSADGDVLINYGYSDAWIVKLTSAGDIEWQTSLGGSEFDEANSIYPTVDGGYIMVGISNSNDGDVTGNHGSHDYWVVKLH